MPARTVKPVVSGVSPEIQQAFNQIAGVIDDPIAKVRVSLGAATVDGLNITRRVTMQVVDRLDGTYPPKAFQAQNGKLDGRWFVWWYFADLKFDAPTTTSPTYTRGRAIGRVGMSWVSQTDRSGVVEFDITRTAGGCWIHTGVPVLMREKGIEWSTGAAITQTDDEPPSTVDPDEDLFPSTPGTHTVCVVITGAQAAAAWAEALLAGTSNACTAVGSLPTGAEITATSFTMIENAENFGGGGGTFSVGVYLGAGQRSAFLASGTNLLTGVIAQLEQDTDGDGVHNVGLDHDPGDTDSAATSLVVTAPNNEIFAIWQFGGVRPIESVTGGMVSMCITYVVGAASGLSDGDYGDITVSAGGTAMDLDLSLDQVTPPAAAVNFNDKEAVSFRIENRTDDPAAPAIGQIWIRTDL